MKIFIDECVDWRLTRSFGQYYARTARQMGWSEVKNGKLLRQAAEIFDVFVTVDRGIEHQNNMQEIDIAVAILMCRKNVLSELLTLMPSLLEYIPRAIPNSITYIRNGT